MNKQRCRVVRHMSLIEASPLQPSRSLNSSIRARKAWTPPRCLSLLLGAKSRAATKAAEVITIEKDNVR